MHGSKFSKPLNVLKTSIRYPLTLLVSNVCKFKSRNLSTYVLSFNDVMSLVKLIFEIYIADRKATTCI